MQRSTVIATGATALALLTTTTRTAAQDVAFLLGQGERMTLIAVHGDSVTARRRYGVVRATRGVLGAELAWMARDPYRTVVVGNPTMSQWPTGVGEQGGGRRSLPPCRRRCSRFGDRERPSVEKAGAEG